MNGVDPNYTGTASAAFLLRRLVGLLNAKHKLCALAHLSWMDLAIRCAMASNALEVDYIVQ